MKCKKTKQNEIKFSTGIPLLDRYRKKQIMLKVGQTLEARPCLCITNDATNVQSKETEIRDINP